MSRSKTGRSGLVTCLNHRVSELGMKTLTRCVFSDLQLLTVGMATLPQCTEVFIMMQSAPS
jgi:hypothetical protein